MASVVALQATVGGGHIVTYRDPLLGRLDHTDDPGFDDPEQPAADDLRGLGGGRPAPDEQRFTRAFDPATGFAWLTGHGHRQARITRLHKNNAARPDSYSGRAA